MLLVGFICFLGSFLITSSVRASPSRYYAGYYHYNYENPYAEVAVQARIYTIDPNVSGTNFVAEWDTIILSYNPLYWTQLGYSKGSDTDYELDYYREKMDVNGHTLDWLPDAPSPGTYHSYTVHWTGSGYVPDTQYNFYIDGVNQGEYHVNPYEPRDHQAFVETTTTQIEIDGSHFKALYVFTGRWPYWDTHVKWDDNPYTVTEVSDHEFYADGGG